MNREILFRGKRTDNGEWIECASYMRLHGNNDKNPNEYGWHIYFWYEGERVEVIPETVGQYTGLDDKNGKKIFDGDIVKDEYNRKMQVYYHDNLHRLLFKLISFESAWSNNFLYADFDSWFLSIEKPTIEIIGNIYDNPELLEEKKW